MTIRLDMEKIEAHPEHMALYKLCIAGVGFNKRGHSTYEFISHDGDFIGVAPTYRVQTFIAFMKRRFGLTICPYPMDHRYDVQRPVTYGWHGIVPSELIQQWMDELFHNPIKLY